MKKSASQESKSLKTFFVYAGIVIFFIVLSLAVKTFFVIRASKFDGDHSFILSVAQNKKVKQVLVFNPAKPQVSVLEVQGESPSSLVIDQKLGFVPDATVDIKDSFDLDSHVARTIREVGFHYNAVKTDLTLFDVFRLALLAQRVQETTPKEILVKGNTVIDDGILKDFFLDDTISSESISIQIINASGESGMGKRLEQVLSGLGFNVVSINTSAKDEKFSKVEYFGNDSYTLQRIKRLFNLPLVKIDNKQIADIIIVIGEDHKNPINF